ncbi:MAG: hypothetical protein PVJ76_08320 [Gemmatimonadota bacterium]
MISRKIAGSLTLLLTFALFQPLGAQDSQPYQWTSDRPDAKAPASITEDRILPEGAFRLGVRYLYSGLSGQGYGTDSLSVDQVLTSFDVSPSEMVTQAFALDFAWGLTNRITLSATGVVARKTMDHLTDIDGQPNAYLFYKTEASGIQDLKANLLYDVLSQDAVRFHVFGGVSVPVGAIDSDDITPFSDPEATQLPYTQQMGSGTFDVSPGFSFNMQNKKASLGLQGKATIRLGENDRGWALGDLYEANMWAGFKGSDWVSASLGLRYANWGNVEGFDEGLNSYESPAHNTLTQAGWRVDLPVGFNFVMPDGQFEGHRLSVEFLFPIHQDLEGPQLKHNWSVAAGWSVDFGF